MRKDKTHLKKDSDEFLELVRAGLFSDNHARILSHGTSINWETVYRLSEEQAVVGLVAAGIDTLSLSERPPQQVVLQFVDQTLQLEQRNQAMNAFIARLVETLGKAGINTLLVKGQGIAQCYEKPLWRTNGDVDLYLSTDNYEKAKAYLIPKAQAVETEDKKRLHLGMTIEGWLVELHGTLRLNLTKRIDRGIDEVHKDVFYNGNVRTWMCGNTQVSLPGVDNDVIFVFTHILQHFFVKESD